MRKNGMVITSNPDGRNRFHNHDPYVDRDLVVDHKAHDHVHLRKGHRRNHDVVVELRKDPLHIWRCVEVGSHRQPQEEDRDALEVASEVGMAQAHGGRNSPEADYACGNHHDEDCIHVEGHDDHSSNRLVEVHRSHGVVEGSEIGNGREAVVVDLLGPPTVCRKCNSPSLP